MKAVKGGRGARWFTILLVAVTLSGLLVILPSDCSAREHKIGIRLNTGLDIQNSNFVVAGAGVDVSVSEHVSLMIDGQANFTLETGYSTLVAGTYLRMSPSRTLCPYLSVAAGIWGDAYSSAGGLYIVADPGVSLRFSQVVNLFTEARFKLLMQDDSHFHAGVPLLLGMRIAF